MQTKVCICVDGLVRASVSVWTHSLSMQTQLVLADRFLCLRGRAHASTWMRPVFADEYLYPCRHNLSLRMQLVLADATYPCGRNLSLWMQPVLADGYWLLHGCVRASVRTHSLFAQTQPVLADGCSRPRGRQTSMRTRKFICSVTFRGRCSTSKLRTTKGPPSLSSSAFSYVHPCLFVLVYLHENPGVGNL
jgi:hypothetical protein